jgi:hypothetical protein
MAMVTKFIISTGSKLTLIVGRSHSLYDARMLLGTVPGSLMARTTES